MKGQALTDANALVSSLDLGMPSSSPNDPKVIKPPTATAVKEHIAAPDEPAMETTMMEAIAIRKWLSFALADIHYQLQMVAKDGTISKRSFQEAKQTAMVIVQYLTGVASDIDERLKASPPIAVPTSDGT